MSLIKKRNEKEYVLCGKYGTANFKNDRKEGIIMYCDMKNYFERFINKNGCKKI